VRSQRVGALVLPAALALGGCGGSPAAAVGSPAAPGGTETATFMGTTTSQGPGSCSGQNHSFRAGEGTIEVTLLQTSTNVALTVQLCADGVSNPSCTIVRRRIDVGMTLGAARAGGANQVLSLLQLTCGAQAPPEPGPVSYSVRVVYPR
jgi:hypothetical protein